MSLSVLRLAMGKKHFFPIGLGKRSELAKEVDLTPLKGNYFEGKKPVLYPENSYVIVGLVQQYFNLNTSKIVIVEKLFFLYTVEQMKNFYFIKQSDSSIKQINWYVLKRLPIKLPARLKKSKSVFF